MMKSHKEALEAQPVLQDSLLVSVCEPHQKPWLRGQPEPVSGSNPCFSVAI